MDTGLARGSYKRSRTLERKLVSGVERSLASIDPDAQQQMVEAMRMRTAGGKEQADMYVPGIVLALSYSSFGPIEIMSLMGISSELRVTEMGSRWLVGISVITARASACLDNVARGIRLKSSATGSH